MKRKRRQSAKILGYWAVPARTGSGTRFVSETTPIYSHDGDRFALIAPKTRGGVKALQASGAVPVAPHVAKEILAEARALDAG